jgi:hypothetical protein
MKLSFLPTVTCVAGLSLACLITRAGGQTTNVQFESAGDLSNFNLVTTGTVTGGNSPTAAGQLAFGSASGRSGTGGLIHTAGGTTDLTAVYTAASFDVTAGTPIDLSVFFNTGAAANLTSTGTGAVLQLGLSGNSTTGVYGDPGNNFISSRVNRPTASTNSYNIQTQVKATTVNGSVTGTPVAPSFSLTADTWYRLTLTVQRTAVADTFSYTTALEDWGTTGASLVSTVSGPLTGTFANADLYTDTTTFGAFRAVEGRATSTFDSFTVVPEPASALLLIGGFTALVGVQRRRRLVA